ncbi:MAG: 3-mercaptopyruvate sulfurtransferase [Chloroflexi bacterium RBG_16_54_11]|nr:MAG: 3-mercaptopyruvate sulfurtransferase [Chloroflexi bacterium RBG_16_54_11]
MPFTTIISVAELALHVEDPEWVIVDARFKLDDKGKGRADYETAHIPGAVYAHLEEDLSGPVIKGVTGRHPLPSVDKVSQVFSRFGIDTSVQVVAYDDMGGTMAAARVWWLLGWMGHAAVAVLDGGWQQWLKLQLPVRGGVERRPGRQFIPHHRDEWIVTADQVDRMRQDPHQRVLDARSADRFRGENETIDPLPGHITGAISAPYAGNLDSEGRFLPREQLSERYRKLLGDVPVDKVVVYCGSGVTAAHDILAMKLAGMGEAGLYAGSYSEWITHPERPVAK